MGGVVWGRMDEGQNGWRELLVMQESYGGGGVRIRVARGSW